MPEEDDKNSNKTFRALMNADKVGEETPKPSQADSQSNAGKDIFPHIYLIA